MLNLLSNAVKFTPAGGAVAVRAEWRDWDLVVTVSDTGVGVAPEDRERIFESFQQGARNKREVEGTGLGLTLSKRIVGLHGGTIWLDRVVGEGSAFHFSLPVGAVMTSPVPAVGVDEQPIPESLDEEAQPVVVVIETTAAPWISCACISKLSAFASSAPGAARRAWT